LNFTSGQEPYSTDCVIFTARRIASAVPATAVPSVRLSVCYTPVLCQNDGTYLMHLVTIYGRCMEYGRPLYLSTFFIPRLISAVAD